MKYLLIFGALSLLFLAGCTQSINDIKNEDKIGDRVVVRGVVDSSIKIGDLSGFVLVDDRDESIAVASDDLPAEGENVIIRGVLMRDAIFGYYIQN
ncbi:MAG: hypothetical protein ACLFN8_00910 [Candidatus Woesearchaeota archaeon]